MPTPQSDADSARTRLDYTSAARLYRSLGMIANAELMEDLARGDSEGADMDPGRAGIGRDGENVGVEEQKK